MFRDGGGRVPGCLVDGKFCAIALFDGAAEVSGKMTIICHPEIQIRMLEERGGQQAGNVSAIHGRILFDGPNVRVLSGRVDISVQTGDE
jgi:hypothetical protein